MQRKLKLQSRISQKVGYKYLLQLPKDYKPTDRKRWPLLLFLHGAGERGSNFALVTKHSPQKLAARKRDFPFFILSPQCPLEQIWDDDALLALLDHVIARYKINTRRVYLTGLSMGGYGVWSLAAKHPERLAAIAPVCGGGSAANLLMANRAQSRALRSLAVRAFHGAKDDVVPLAEAKVLMAALKKAGCREATLTVYPNTGHDSWTRTYTNPKLYEWFLKHERKQDKFSVDAA